MVLYLNVFITNARYHWPRGYLPNDDRFDVFKYCLASLSALKWEAVFLYVKLDNEYQHRSNELVSFCNDIFDTKKLEVNLHRSEIQSHWQKNIESVLELNDNKIFFLCNDDHIFVDYDLDNLNKSLEIYDAEPSPYKSIYISHWPENYRIATKNRNHQIYESGHVKFDWACRDSIQIITPEVLKYWWHENDYGDTFLPRSDWVNLFRAGPELKVIIPPREISRHFDAYTHIGMEHNKATPLSIPQGFFESNMKVALNTSIPGFVSLNPMHPNYRVVDHGGADLKIMKEDIPLFWKNRITDIVEHEVNREELVANRNRAFFEYATVASHHHDVDNNYNPPESWCALSYRK